MKKPQGRPISVTGKAFTFAEVLAEGQRRIAEEEARVAKMTPEEKEAYELELAERAKETEKILKQLRGPGFMEIKFP